MRVGPVGRPKVPKAHVVNAYCECDEMIADDGMGDANFVQFSASTQPQGHHQLQTKRQ
jgi:hypothetical protein